MKVLGEGLSVLLNRPWDPVVSSLVRRKLEKLPGNAIIIVAPPGIIELFYRKLFKGEKAAWKRHYHYDPSWK